VKRSRDQRPSRRRVGAQQPPVWLVPAVGLPTLAEPDVAEPEVVDPPEAFGAAFVIFPVPMPLGEVALPVVPDAPHGKPVTGLVPRVVVEPDVVP
jgi:hypothetical protein